MLLIINTVPGFNGQLNFTADNGNSGIIFSKLANAHISHESCTIYSYYDMAGLYQTGHQIELALANLNRECDEVMDGGCKIRKELVEEQYNYAKYNLAKIHNKSRLPRFIVCEWCGRVVHFLYGNMDAEEARTIIKIINNSSDAIVENRNLIKNTTHLVEAILGEEKDRVDNLNEKVVQFYSGMINEIDDKIKRRDLIDITNSLVSEYKTLINSVEQAFAAEATGQIPKILKTVAFKNQIQSISKKLKAGNTFTIDVYESDISEILRFASESTRKESKR